MIYYMWRGAGASESERREEVGRSALEKMKKSRRGVRKELLGGWW